MKLLKFRCSIKWFTNECHLMFLFILEHHECTHQMELFDTDVLKYFLLQNGHQTVPFGVYIHNLLFVLIFVHDSLYFCSISLVSKLVPT